MALYSAMGTGAGPAYWFSSISSRAFCRPVPEIWCSMPALRVSPWASEVIRTPVVLMYPSSARNLRVLSRKLKGRQVWAAMSRPSMLPLKYRTFRTRSQMKLNGRPVSSAERGSGGRAIGEVTGAAAKTAISADCVIGSSGGFEPLPSRVIG